MSSRSPGQARPPQGKGRDPQPPDDETSSDDDTSDFTTSDSDDDSDNDTPPPRPDPPRAPQPKLYGHEARREETGRDAPTVQPPATRPPRGRHPGKSRFQEHISSDDEESGEESTGSNPHSSGSTLAAPVTSRRRARTTHSSPPRNHNTTVGQPRSSKPKAAPTTTRQKPPSRRPSPDARRATPQSDSTSLARGPSNRNDPERGRYDSDAYHDDDGCRCGGCAGSCSGCVECWTGIVEWRIWSWIRQKSAFIVGFATCLGMLAAGGTGLMDWWVFVAVDGYDLGGLGYCQGAACTTQPFYDIDLGTMSPYLRSRVLSGLLLAMSAAGAIFTILLVWMAVNAYCCGDTFTPPLSIILCCFFKAPPDRPTPDELRRAAHDNGMEKDQVGSAAGSREMITQVRIKDHFQNIMFYGVWPVAIVLGGCLWAWTEAAKGEERLGFQCVMWGGMAMLVLYLITINIYRPTSLRASRQKISHEMLAKGLRAARANAKKKVKVAAQGAAGRARETAGRARETAAPKDRRGAGGR